LLITSGESVCRRGVVVCVLYMVLGGEIRLSCVMYIRIILKGFVTANACGFHVGCRFGPVVWLMNNILVVGFCAICCFSVVWVMCIFCGWLVVSVLWCSIVVFVNVRMRCLVVGVLLICCVVPRVVVI
jgi:hypothetical protein